MKKWLGFTLFCISLAMPGVSAQEKFIMGASTQFAHGKGVIDSNLRLFQAAGLTSPRDGTPWRHWDPKRGTYAMPQFTADYLDAALKMGLVPFNVITSQNLNVVHGYPKSPEAVEEYAKCVEAIAARYKGKLRLYQIWNEWDGGCGMLPEFSGQGDAASYSRLLAATYPRIKKIDPNCVVIANSVCTGEKFLEESFKAGVLQHCDAFSFHSYTFGAVGENRYPEAYIVKVKKAIELSKKYNNGIAKPLYLSEIGWPNNTKRGGDEKMIGDYAARTFLLAKTLPEVKGLWWYNFQDDGYDYQENENNFGTLMADLTPKESYFVLRSISPVINDGRFVGQLASPDPTVILLLFEMPDQSQVLAAWTTRPECRKQLLLERGTAPDAPLRLTLCGYESVDRRWGFREWLDAGIKKFSWSNIKKEAQENPRLFAFSITGRPVLLAGKLNGIKLLGIKTIDRPQQSEQGKLAIPEKVGEVLPASGNLSQQPLTQLDLAADYRQASKEAPKGKNDFGADFKLSYDAKNLYVTIHVIDNIHFQEKSGGNLWEGDSLQIAFASYKKFKPAPAYGSEYQIGLKANGEAEVFRQSSQLDLKTPTEVKASIRREDGKTQYLLTVPLREIGISRPVPGIPLGLSLLINENDGQGRKGYLHWGDGIGTGNKFPEEYNWVIFR